MAISADWIAQNTATTGTGTITLGTALTGFIRLQDDSRITDGALVNYTIEDGNNREMGIGTYTSAGGTLARTVVQRTLVGGTFDDSSPTAISLSGSAVVRCSAVADDRNFRGVLCRKSGTQSIANNASFPYDAVSWDSTEDYDTDGFHDTVTNNSRIVIPSGIGITHGRFYAGGRWEANASGYRYATILKNATNDICTTTYTPEGSSRFILATPVLAVSDGDYFTLNLYQASGGALDFFGASTDVYFAFEAIP